MDLSTTANVEDLARTRGLRGNLAVEPCHDQPPTKAAMRSLLLLLLGIPIPIIILIALFVH